MGDLVLKLAAGVGEAGANAAATDFKAGEAAVAARRGKIAAAETDTAIREELSSVIGNIRAIRASSGISPDSPTTDAIIDSETRASERQRRIRVGNITEQAASDERSSGFLRSSANSQFLYGTLGSVARFGSDVGSRYR